MKETAYIRKLIDRYMEGETSLDEESMLYAYFSRTDIPSEFEEYKDMFAGLSSIVQNEKIKADIDRFRTEGFELTESAAEQHTAKRKLLSFRRIISIAAATVALAIGIFYISDKMDEKRLTALYGGSYMIVNGKRIDDLQKIESDIERVLAYANEIEKSADINANIKNIEEELLNSIDDEERKEEIRQMLK